MSKISSLVKDRIRWVTVHAGQNALLNPRFWDAFHRKSIWNIRTYPARVPADRSGGMDSTSIIRAGYMQINSHLPP